MGVLFTISKYVILCFIEACLGHSVLRFKVLKTIGSYLWSNPSYNSVVPFYNLQPVYKDHNGNKSNHFLFLARLDEVQKSLCTTPGVGVDVSAGVHIYVKVF